MHAYRLQGRKDLAKTAGDQFEFIHLRVLDKAIEGQAIARAIQRGDRQDEDICQVHLIRGGSPNCSYYRA